MNGQIVMRSNFDQGENYALIEVKSTFPASNAQALRLWWIADAKSQGSVLLLVPVYANLSPNRSVIR